MQSTIRQCRHLECNSLRVAALRSESGFMNAPRVGTFLFMLGDDSSGDANDF